MFSQSMYVVNESAWLVRPVLVLNNPSATDTVVQVTNTDGTAIGEYCSVLINYNSLTNMLQEEVRIMILDHTLSHSCWTDHCYI